MNELLAASSGRTVTVLPVGTEGIKGFPLTIKVGNLMQIHILLSSATDIVDFIN